MQFSVARFVSVLVLAGVCYFGAIEWGDPVELISDPPSSQLFPSLRYHAHQYQYRRLKPGISTLKLAGVRRREHATRFASAVE